MLLLLFFYAKRGEGDLTVAEACVEKKDDGLEVTMRRDETSIGHKKVLNVNKIKIIITYKPKIAVSGVTALTRAVSVTIRFSFQI